MAWPTSDQWDAALRTSYTASVRAEVWRNGSSTGTSVSVNGGSVTADESSKVRRILSLTSADVALMPSKLGDVLSPVDTDLQVYCGVQYTQGYVEEVPVGLFRVTAPSRSGLMAGLSLAGVDYAGLLAQSRFIRPWVTPAGSRIVDEIQRMIQDVLPWVTVLDLSGSPVRTKAATWDKDRWDAVEAMADSVGAECYFDPTGQAVFRAVPTTANPVAWRVDSNTATAVLLDVAQSMDIVGVYNAVVAASSDANLPPMSAAAYQRTGPLAYRDGVKYPRFYASPLLTTTAQCASAAKSLLARSLAYSVKLTPSSAPNPALEVGDVLSLTLPSQPPVLRVLSKFTLSLSLAPMTMEVRSDADATVGVLT